MGSHSWPHMLHCLLYVLVSTLLPSQARSDLEKNVASSYKDLGAVSSHFVEVDGDRIHYLEAGPSDGRVVIFCHGAAFRSKTWQITGVLDDLASHGFRALALDFPGYGTKESGSTKLGASAQRTFLHAFADALHVLDNGEQVVVVSASMGGSFGLPFVLEASGQHVAGYVTVAGSTSAFQHHDGVSDTPVLAIFGELDSRVRSDPELYKKYFRHCETVIFPNAPHPAYLRDVAAARHFSSLVLKFVEGTGTVGAHWGEQVKASAQAPEEMKALAQASAQAQGPATGTSTIGKMEEAAKEAEDGAEGKRTHEQKKGAVGVVFLEYGVSAGALCLCTYFGYMKYWNTCRDKDKQVVSAGGPSPVVGKALD